MHGRVFYILLKNFSAGKEKVFVEKIEFLLPLFVILLFGQKGVLLVDF